MAVSSKSPHGADRPEFMAVLGLLPPYTIEDVKQAYLARIKGLRPEGDSDGGAFAAVQQAYDEARQYVEFRADRRGWIATRVDEYLAVLAVIERLQAYGAEVETDAVDWVEKSLGDFAELTASIVGVRLRDSASGDEVIGYMIGEHERLLELRRLDLAGCVVSDGSIRQLSVFRRLAELDLSRTPISWEALHVVEWLPALESANVDGTAVKWWTRRKLQARLRQKRKAAAVARALHPASLR